jgi:hypothetical protein
MSFAGHYIFEVGPSPTFASIKYNSYEVFLPICIIVGAILIFLCLFIPGVRMNGACVALNCMFIRRTVWSQLTFVTHLLTC